jgi:chorismate mutase / prephenate dehydrogenase
MPARKGVIRRRPTPERANREELARPRPSHEMFDREDCGCGRDPYDAEADREGPRAPPRTKREKREHRPSAPEDRHRDHRQGERAGSVVAVQGVKESHVERVRDEAQERHGQLYCAVMPSRSFKLDALRKRLTHIDDQVLDLVGARMRVVREVAALKEKKGIAPFDRDREIEKMDELCARAAGLAIPPEVVRDVFGGLFAASRASQRLILAEAEPRFSVGVIGGTRGMGGFLARVLAKAGFPVEVTGLEEGPPAGDVAARNDLVIVAVPIAATVSVIHEVAPRVRAGACLVDVTSVKQAPLAAMLSSAGPEVDVVGTHPMFGPHAGDDMDRQRVVLCRGRGEAGYARVKRMFELFGAEVVESDAVEHDAQMALIQVLIHEKTLVLGSVLERLKAPLSRSLDFASPIYRAELAMIGRLYSQQANLYADILTSNPDGARVSALFSEEAARFATAVNTVDRGSIVRRFEEVASFLAAFAAWAKKESDAILHDVVRHG